MKSSNLPPLSPAQQPTHPQLIAEITNRLIHFYNPLRIYLFGSAARGDSGPDSDFDFCVLLPDDAPPQLFRDRSIHARFWGLDASIDVVRLSESDFDNRAKHVVTSLPATILREGRLLYQRPEFHPPRQPQSQEFSKPKNSP
jgi:predicted nucleotidyltransferase